ncbi:phosphoglycerate dehydrogenase [Fodinibius sp. AD559]|uniref:phosphoglycerate dehydrogenase n=1 Tax=Fodinibius sp. AD559 TaxID=3424179 RepID=UPI0040468CB5
MKILLTTTSFQDTPGKHHDLLDEQDFEIDKERGPLKEEELLPIIDQYDGVICSDDEYTEAVIRKGAESRLKIISKYGVGLDQIDLDAAEKYGVKVTNCPGVNQVSVAEHVLALTLSFYRNIHLEYNITKQGKWDRYVGDELRGKTIGILGLGSVGKETAKIMGALGLKAKAYDKFMDYDFAEEHDIEVAETLEELLDNIDILSLHLPLNDETRGMITLNLLKRTEVKDVLIVNTARAELIEFDAIEKGLQEGILAGYCTDVMDEEPMPSDHPLKDMDNVLITPHIGSRTYQSVERQGRMAINNLLDHI